MQFPDDGRFPYSSSVDQAHPGASMTAAGLLALTLDYALDERPKGQRDPLQDPAIRKGLEYLSKSIVFPPATPSPAQAYALWSVGRVGVLYQIDKIGGKDWYGWGVEVLKIGHKPNGRWQYVQPDWDSIPDTCFCLLFLERANLVQDLTDKLELLEGPAPPPQMGRKD